MEQIKGQRILITSGGCEEAIDGVRTLSNFSSGKTGAVLADSFYLAGYSVVLIKGKKAEFPKQSFSLATDLSDLSNKKVPEITVFEFGGFKDLEQLLRKLSSIKFKAVFFAAAVSDFGIKKIKIGSTSYNPGDIPKITAEIIGTEDLSIQLFHHPKLIDLLPDLFGPNCCIVGFKLTNQADLNERKKAVLSLFNHSGAAAVISNDLSEISGQKHQFVLYKPDLSILGEGQNKSEMAAVLKDLITK